jgi:hypothetical protein
MNIKYELLKYKYGWRNGRKNSAYTAFCLTPAIPRRTTLPDGRIFASTNAGDYSDHAQHFQTPEAALEWAAKHEVEIVNPDWTPLPDTTIWPPGTVKRLQTEEVIYD